MVFLAFTGSCNAACCPYCGVNDDNFIIDALLSRVTTLQDSVRTALVAGSGTQDEKPADQTIIPSLAIGSIKAGCTP